METTFLHHKPVQYGSTFANCVFLTILLIHILAGAIAPVSAIVAFATRKGGKLHLRSGRAFAWSMVIVALSGIVVDLARLCFFVRENHTKYAGHGMPSTYPARLGFLFAGLCILYVLREATPPRVFRRQPGAPSGSLLPGLIAVTGLSLTLLIVLRYNPWTGALWMIWTFLLIVVIVARGASSPARDREADVARHRFGMSCLAGFSWWGALQGFGPAIAIAMRGDDPSTSPYVGDQPGPFSPTFFLFLVPWAPFFVLAAFLIRRFSRLRRAGSHGQ